MSERANAPTNTHILAHRFDYVRPGSLRDAVAALKEHGEKARVLAGGTNLIVDMKLEKVAPEFVVDLSGLSELIGIREEAGTIRIGALTPIRTVATSDLLWRKATALAEAAAAFGSTQVAIRGTIGGNVCNGSPASDTVPALLALEAEAVLAGPDGERIVAVGDLLKEPGKTRLRTGEILQEVRLTAAGDQTTSAFLKLSRVRADLSKVSVAARVVRDGEAIRTARIELGSVGSTVTRARKVEAGLNGKAFSEFAVLEAARLVSDEIQPIDDVRSTADYRRKAAVALVHDAVLQAWTRFHTGPIAPREGRRSAAEGSGERSAATAADVPRGEWQQSAAEAANVARAEAAAPLPRSREPKQVGADERVWIHLTVNSVPHELEVASNELLLNVLRDRLELTGTKYGCGIGECSACTVWLNGEPVLGCLVLAVAADGGDVRTIEGLAAPDGTLDPLQEAFIEENAFQCGYCTPAMLMMSKRLLEEIPEPTEDEIRDYLKGNRCRCTGYAGVVRAVKRAAGRNEK